MGDIPLADTSEGDTVDNPAAGTHVHFCQAPLPLRLIRETFSFVMVTAGPMILSIRLYSPLGKLYKRHSTSSLQIPH